MKTLFAVVLATALVATPVKAATDAPVTDVVDNEVLTALVEAEVAKLEETNPVVKAVMRSQASKTKVYAIATAAVVAAVAGYLVLDKYYLNWIFDSKEQKEKKAADAKIAADAAGDGVDVVPVGGADAVCGNCCAGK